jgi:hypothetical protein
VFAFPVYGRHKTAVFDDFRETHFLAFGFAKNCAETVRGLQEPSIP